MTDIDKLIAAIAEQTAASNRVADALMIHAAEIRAYLEQVHELIAPSGEGGTDPMEEIMAAAREAGREGARDR